MELIQIFRDADQATRKDMVITALLAAVGAVTLLALINSASQVAAQGRTVPLHTIALYLVAFALCYLGNRTSLTSAYEVMENALQRLRERVAEKISRARLADIEALGRGDLYTTLSEGTSHLSQVTPALMSGLQQGLLALGCLVYIGSISLSGFLVFAGITALAFGLFWRFRRAQQQARAEAADTDAAMLDSLASFVDGFKEIRTNYRKSSSLHHSFNRLAADNEKSRLRLSEAWAFTTLWSNVYLFELLAILVFVLPHFVADLDQSIVKLAAATLFVVGPISTVVNVLPSVEQAQSGLRALSALEARLDQALDAVGQPAPPLSLEPFERLEVHNATFSYRDSRGEAGFTSGPWSLDARPGEVIFVVGGNGAGKSTLLKLLTGLYPLAAGSISVNGRPIPDGQPLGELFAGVFFDFHLFDRLYGLEEVDPQAVRALLVRMGLRGQVDYEGGKFTTLHLSTGQRKRLALIVALLEDKPIYIFDEWACDQDKAFRDEFYRRILPELRQRNKLVIAVTHDERYFEIADRVLKLESGCVVEGKA